jgi:hypothetical protein
MENWRTFSMDWDTAPINLSFLLDPPAGKHGLLGVKDDRFVFEDGTEIRFWGISVTGSACFPSPEMAPRIADRLAKFGFNLVRFHEMDSDWSEPKLILESATPDSTLNSEAMDRLDYFIHQLGNRGIYSWLDGLTARKLQEGDGILSWKYIPPGLKGYSYFSPDMLYLHLEYLDDLWTHQNKYPTIVREYRDNPAIVLTELFHDNNLFIDIPRENYYLAVFTDNWIAWNRMRGIQEPKPFNWDNPTKEMQEFLVGIMRKTNIQIGNYLREHSVKIPLSGTGTLLAIRDLYTQLHFDFIQSHAIWNQTDIPKQFSYNRMVDIDTRTYGNLFSQLASFRVYKKPFVVSKWGNPWPNPYRAELPLWMAAMSGYQDWQGCIASTYSTLNDKRINWIYAPFESFNDPCVMGLMPAAALLFHRNEIPQASRKISMGIHPKEEYQNIPFTTDRIQTTKLVEDFKIDLKFKKRPTSYTILAPSQPIQEKMSDFSHDKNEYLQHDANRGVVCINTSTTQACIGDLSKIKSSDLRYVDLDSNQDFGVCSISSIDGKSIPDSKDLWITIVSEAQNEGFKHKRVENYSFIQESGQAPIKIKPTPTRLYIQTNQQNWDITLVDGNGKSIKTLPYQIEENRISFRIGVHESIYYRLLCMDNIKN